MLEYSYSLVGGSLNSIKVDGVERMYQPMEGSWGGHDVVIFPFIARLINQTYTHKGVSYSMKNHGLARYNEFKVVEEKENSSKILFESNVETLKQYPFNFKIYVTYKKENNKLYKLPLTLISSVMRYK